MEVKEAKKISNTLKPFMQIGKNGLSETVLKEIEQTLKKQKLIKIKCLKYFIESLEGENNKEKIKNTAEIIAKETKSQIINIVGFNITMARTLEKLKLYK